jgi:hypothetical protein
MLCRTRVGKNAGVLRLRIIIRFANDYAALRMTKMVRVGMDPVGLKSEIQKLKSRIPTESQTSCHPDPERRKGICLACLTIG